MALTLSFAKSDITPNYRAVAEPRHYSFRNTSAVDVRAAIRPGIVATTLASARAPTTMKTMTRPGTLGIGTASISCAKRFQRMRPSAIPIGTPITAPIATATLRPRRADDE